MLPSRFATVTIVKIYFKTRKYKKPTIPESNLLRPWVHHIEQLFRSGKTHVRLYLHVLIVRSNTLFF